MPTASTHTQSQSVTPLVNRSIDNVRGPVKSSLRQTFSQYVNVANLFIHALLYSTPNK